VERRWARAFSALFANDVVTHAARAERLRTPFGSGADTLTVRLTALRSLGMRERKKRQAHPSPDKTPADDAWLSSLSPRAGRGWRAERAGWGASARFL